MGMELFLDRNLSKECLNIEILQMAVKFSWINLINFLIQLILIKVVKSIIQNL